MFTLKIDDFDLTNTFENGQCFRFMPYKEGYLGVALNKALYLAQASDGIIVDGVSMEEFDSLFVPYFDLERDYSAIAAGFKAEENLKAAIQYGHGMKILRQDPWEALFSFVISQNNSINRIKVTVERICDRFGKKTEYDGATLYCFPTPEDLKDATEQQFSLMGCGYRSDYLVHTVRAALDGRLDFDRLKTCGYFNAKEELMQLKGVGPKVADCVSLFGLNYLDAFPVDTWIKKVMEVLYLKRSATNQEIWQYAREAFGEYAGIAQQYLFYYARENKLKGL